MKRFVAIRDFGDKDITSASGSGFPGKLLLFLLLAEDGFVLGLGLGFGFGGS